MGTGAVSPGTPLGIARRLAGMGLREEVDDWLVGRPWAKRAEQLADSWDQEGADMLTAGPDALKVIFDALNDITKVLLDFADRIDRLGGGSS